MNNYDKLSIASHTLRKTFPVLIKFNPGRKTTLTSVNSVGNGPSPTLVVYALTTPITSPIADGGKPSPVQTPPMLQFDDVTYG